MMRKDTVMKFLKYAFYITMTCLAIVNVCFFICNWKDMQMELNQESVLLTVVGFFFAFAGINIYSIFNTNIENEKQSLRDLESQYDNRLRLSEKELLFPKNLIKAYQKAQYLASTNSLTIYSYDWINTIKIELDDMLNFVKKIKECGNDRKFDMYRVDLANLAKGILILLNEHESKIRETSFFKQTPEEKEHYSTEVEELIRYVEKIRIYSYDSQAIVEKELSFWGKIGEIIKFSVKLFKK